MAERIGYYLDEHVNPAVADGLRRRGVAVLTTGEAGLLSASDETQLARAIHEGFVIFTQDEDFLRLHASGAPHGGIVYAPQHTPVGHIVRGLMLIYDILEPNDLRNHAEFL